MASLYKRVEQPN